MKKSLFFCLIATFLFFSCEGFDVYFADQKDIKQELMDGHTIEYTFYDGITSYGIKKRYNIGDEISEKSFFPSEFNPGYRSTWRCVDLDTGIDIDPPNVRKVGSEISSVYVTTKPLVFVSDGSWVPRTDTPYTVRHYLENIDNTKEPKYSLYETETRYGTTDAPIQLSVCQKSYEGFEYHNNLGSGTISGDGSGFVNIEYNRKVVSVTINSGAVKFLDGTDQILLFNGNPIPDYAPYGSRYGAPLIVPKFESTSLQFAGFQKEGTEEIFSKLEKFPSEDTTYTAVWKSQGSIGEDFIIDDFTVIIKDAIGNMVVGFEHTTLEPKMDNVNFTAEISFKDIDKFDSSDFESIDIKIYNGPVDITNQLTMAGMNITDLATNKKKVIIPNLYNGVYDVVVIAKIRGVIYSGTAQFFVKLHEGS